MDDSSRTPETSPHRGRPGGLYRGADEKVSVRAVNFAIVFLVAAAVVLTIVGARNGGFIVSFDSRGGSDIAPQKIPYGDRIEEPQPPTREGYRFTGWYIDANCYDPYDFSEQTVTENITLYAGWE